MTNREKIIRINEIAVRCINAGPISLETGIEKIREIVNGDALNEPREDLLKLRDALLLARDALDRMMGDTDLDDDDSIEMRAMQAIASTLEEAPNAD